MTDPRNRTSPGGPDDGAPREPADEPPGWDGLFDEGPAAREWPPPGMRGLPDLSPLVQLLEALARTVPAELREQLAALQREILLTIRAFIDWYLERLDARTRAPQVEDIPID